MKKIITLLVLICSLSVMAQEYTPLVREGVKWECVSEQIGWWEMDPVPFSIYFKGDTIVNDIEYKKCYIESDTAKFVAALMREDVAAKQVFVYYPESLFGDTYNARIHIHILDHFKSHQDLEKEYVLYDFNNIYNSAMIAEWKSVTNITDESFISVGDKQCKRTRVTNKSSVNSNTQSAFFSVVEGVGFVSEAYNKQLFYSKGCFYEGIMFDFLSYDQTNDGWEMITYFNRLVADDGTVLYESPNTYTPLVREGVKWNCLLCGYSSRVEEDNFEHKYHIEFKGDTIINDKAYKKCYYIFEKSANYPNETPRAFVREDVAAKKVYAMFNPEYKHDKVYQMIDIYNYYNELYSEVLLYDFSNILNPEQYWFNSISSESYSVKTIQVAENNCKMFTLKSQFDIPELDIDLLESVGFCKGNDNAHDKRGCGDLLAPFPSIWLGGYNSYPVFLNFEDAEGNIVYVAQEYNGIESVASTDKDAVEATRYDLYGRRLSQPAQGVNIVKMSDGTTRKEMVK